eukprot:244048-Pelagomonas_calceolata.AAC.1
MAEEEPRDEFEELLGEDNDADFPLEEEQAAGAVPDGSEEVGKGPQEEGTGEQKADAAATPRETTGDKDLLGRNEDTVDGLLDDYDNEDFFGEGDQQDGQGQAPQGEGAPQVSRCRARNAALPYLMVAGYWSCTVHAAHSQPVTTCGASLPVAINRLCISVGACTNKHLPLWCLHLYLFFCCYQPASSKRKV